MPIPNQRYAIEYPSGERLPEGQDYPPLDKPGSIR